MTSHLSAANMADLAARAKSDAGEFLGINCVKALPKSYKAAKSNICKPPNPKCSKNIKTNRVPAQMNESSSSGRPNTVASLCLMKQNRRADRYDSSESSDR